MGDPDFVDVPLDMLLSPAYAADRAARIRAGEKASVPRSELAKDPPTPRFAASWTRRAMR